MMCTDDPAVIRHFLRICSIKLNQRFFQMLEKFRSDILKYKDVVRRGAGLTGIEPPPKGDATSRNSQISRRVYDGRILSPEFEHDWCQVLRCRSHDDLGHCRAASEKDVIPLLFEQCGGFGDRAEDDRKRLAIKVLRNEPRDSFSRCGGYLRRLDDSGVASRNRCDQWRQRQHQGVIPCPDDQSDSERIELHFCIPWSQLERCAYRNRLHPVPELRKPVVDISTHVFHVSLSA